MSRRHLRWGAALLAPVALCLSVTQASLPTPKATPAAAQPADMAQWTDAYFTEALRKTRVL